MFNFEEFDVWKGMSDYCLTADTQYLPNISVKLGGIPDCSLAVKHRRRYGELTLAACLHANDADIPALDHIIIAKRKLELHGW